MFDKIKQPIQTELEQCHQLLSQSFQHKNPLLNQALQQVRSRSGKMMRPMLVLLSAKLFNEVNDNAIRIAAAYESFHTASLIHDDVVDESDERRGQDSMNQSFNNKVAVLVGDYILTLSLHNIAATRNAQLIDIMSSAAKGLSNGELLQLYNIQKEKVTEETYFEIIRNKTATLFAACAASGAIAAGAKPSDVDIMFQFGEKVGMCFQIKDDLFDYGDENVGKPTGNDMREGKFTLPAIFAINQGEADMDQLVYKVKHCSASESDIKTLIDYTKEKGGIDYAILVMNRYADEAIHLLDRYPESATKTALLQYVDYVVGRDF